MSRIKSCLSAALLAGASSVYAINCYAEKSPAKADPKFQEQIEKYLESERGQERIGMAAEKYFREMQMRQAKQAQEREGALLEEQFKNPVKLEIGNSPTKGPANAAITIIEFSDFQCPFCQRGANVMDEVMKAYPNQVKLVFKNLPLAMHPQATPAAKAALAAGKQGKFWEMHDKLFANQQKLNPQYYEQAAKELGLDVEKFKTDMNDPAIEEQIKADVALAEKHDITGTPGFFVNGVAVKGAYPLQHFKKIIDRWLAKK
ncbi:MAG: thioredoxin domain-containing protein [Deltaproteobacteria bacterium]|nr:thioredoxin domain-containing protein [Deltaproteobacteria bacterium]